MDLIIDIPQKERRETIVTFTDGEPTKDYWLESLRKKKYL